MTEHAKFQLKLTGGLADGHEFEGYDGYTALAGAAWTLSLVTNYVGTGQIRHRGDFPGRHAVHALPMKSGSLLADFSVLLQGQPASVFGIGFAAGASGLLYGLVNRVILRNLGQDPTPLNNETAALLERKDGDVEALVAITEPSLRQAHEVIGNSASGIEWIGGFNTMAHLNAGTKAYMKASIPDHEVIQRDVMVTGFYGNSGHGSVFDFSLGHNVPFSMKRDDLRRYGPYFSWGLDQYTNDTGRRLSIKFTRIISMDGTAKRYIIVSADYVR